MINKPTITQILFATDLSENANCAFGYATSMADAYGASVTVLHVLEKIPPKAELMLALLLEYRDVDELRQKNQTDLIKHIQTRIERFCSEAVDQIPECRIILQKIIVEPGKAADRIIHHTATGVYDALVIGSRGHSPIQEALLGGTAHKVLHRCRVPVFVVPLLNE